MVAIRRTCGFLSLCVVVLLPAVASAQSAIAGVVRDASGAVLPGVTVEASSEVLIEKTRSVTTDGSGQYRIVDLRPGMYVVTFALTGFQTVRREEIQLPADFTANINADLRVGALEESIVVTGATPVVDVSSTAKVQVLTREVLDSVPTGRTIQGLAQLIVGVSLSSPDVGGSRAMQQTYMSTRGLTSANNIVTVDGLMINGLDGDGAVQQYLNNSMVEEMVYQTSGAGADVSPGGVRLNVVPKDGGNAFSGSFFGAWSDGAWQSDNFSQSLRDRGLRAADKIERIYDFNFAEGGPILRDKLWFFGSARAWSVNSPIADTFYPDGSQGIDDQKIKSAVLRLTWQVTPRNKFAIYYDEIDKYRGHGMNAGDDPLTASQVWTSPRYNDSVAKWTSTLSNRLMIEGGFSFNYEQYVITNQDGVNKDAFTPEWFAGASRRDADRVTLRSGLANWGGRYPDRFNLAGSVSYVTGSHTFKAGIQDNWGPYVNTRETNADLQQVYRSGRPDSVAIYNTPVRYKERLNADVGIFAQDTWTMKRLTINGGLRWEYLNAEVSEQQSGAGRFVGERRFDAIQMPIWKDWAPRFGVIYDAFGNAKTALKFGVNRYNESRTTQFANRYNPLGLTSATLSWTDLNGDDVAQGTVGCVYLSPGCEMNFAQMPANFGRLSLSRVDPDFKRTYNIETTAGVQHELLPRVSLGATWYRRTFHRLRITDNLLISTTDYAPVQIVSPLNGEVITAFNLDRAKLRDVDNFDTNAGSDRQQIYSGVDLTLNARLPGGATIFGGFITERTLRVTCDEPDDPNTLRFCDDRENAIPFRPQLKLAGTYMAPWRINLSASFQSLAGRPTGGFSTTGFNVNKISGPGYGDVGSPVGTQWLISPTTRYPANCTAPCTPGGLVVPGMTQSSLTIPLVAPGTEFLPRLKQLDLSVGKQFQIGRLRLQGQLDVFNVFNENTILGVRSTNFATAAYDVPSSILQGRIVRIGTQLRW
jgi:Carboxypeptidase regulatory-like domain/TonB-dependent Receptor Plug Domain